MNMKQILYPLSISALLLTSCAHELERKKMAANLSPQELMNYNQIELKRAKVNQSDVLAPQLYSKGLDYYSEAKEIVSDEKKTLNPEEEKELRENVEYSMAYLEKALEKAGEKKEFYKPILEARVSAIEFGALQTKELKDNLNDIDSDFKSAVEGQNGRAADDTFVALQKRYLDLRTKSLEERELGQLKQNYDEAISNGARYKVPEQQDRTWKAIEVAQNSIRNAPTNPEEYEEKVLSATKESIILSDLLSIIEKNGGEVKESVARQLYEKDSRINTLDSRVDALRTQVTYQYGQIKSLDNKVFFQQLALTSAKDEVMAEEKYKEVKKQFEKTEAEVYREGSDIIIRLKKVNFPVGKSNLTPSSKETLKKVENVLKEANTEEVVVVGHTDSTGPDKLNKNLSKKRAQEVVNYLERNIEDVKFTVEADSFDNPIAANKTSQGRKMNRRVDIIIKG